MLSIGFVRTDLNTLLTALYVRIDDHLRTRVRPGRPPRLTDAELLTLAVAQALLGVRSEARWLRLVPAALPGAFPYLPGQSGYNKRLRAALPLLKWVIRVLAVSAYDLMCRWAYGLTCRSRGGLIMASAAPVG